MYVGYACWKRVEDCSARQRHPPVTVVIHEALHERIRFPRDTGQGDEWLTVIRVLSGATYLIIISIIIRSPHVPIRMRSNPDGAP